MQLFRIIDGSIIDDMVLVSSQLKLYIVKHPSLGSLVIFIYMHAKTQAKTVVSVIHLSIHVNDRILFIPSRTCVLLHVQRFPSPSRAFGKASRQATQYQTT